MKSFLLTAMLFTELICRIVLSPCKPNVLSGKAFIWLWISEFYFLIHYKVSFMLTSIVLFNISFGSIWLERMYAYRFRGFCSFSNWLGTCGHLLRFCIYFGRLHIGGRSDVSFCSFHIRKYIWKRKGLWSVQHCTAFYTRILWREKLF